MRNHGRSKSFVVLFAVGLGMLASPVAATSDGPTIVRLAGSDVLPGFGGDGGPATLAGVPHPVGLALDPDGHLYVTADGGFRRIDAVAGVIESIPEAKLAAFGSPGSTASSVCRDAVDDFYFGGANVPLQKFTTATATRTAVATPTVETPSWLAMGPGGDLYVVYRDSSRIYRIALPGGSATLVAGTGVRGFSGDGGPAAEAQLNWPAGLAFDADGNLFVADQFNHRRRARHRGRGRRRRAGRLDRRQSLPAHGRREVPRQPLDEGPREGSLPRRDHALRRHDPRVEFSLK